MKYAKTEAGQQAFKTRSAELAARLRPAFILFDGKKTVDEVLAMTAGLGVVEADIQHLVASGLLEAVARASIAPVVEKVENVQEVPSTPAEESSSLSSLQQRYARAWPIATQITASLGLRGVRLNIAVERAADYEELRDLLPKIREAVGAEKVKPLERALKE
jgi:hypothetical protein